MLLAPTIASVATAPPAFAGTQTAAQWPTSDGQIVGESQIDVNHDESLYTPCGKTWDSYYAVSVGQKVNNPAADRYGHSPYHFAPSQAVSVYVSWNRTGMCSGSVATSATLQLRKMDGTALGPASSSISISGSTGDNSAAPVTLNLTDQGFGTGGNALVGGTHYIGLVLSGNNENGADTEGHAANCVSTCNANVNTTNYYTKGNLTTGYMASLYDNRSGDPTSHTAYDKDEANLNKPLSLSRVFNNDGWALPANRVSDYAAGNSGVVWSQDMKAGVDYSSFTQTCLCPSFTGGTSNGTTTYTAPSGTFVSSDANQLIQGTDIPNNTLISSVTNSSTVTLNNAATGSHSNLAFKISRRSWSDGQTTSGSSTYYSPSGMFMSSDVGLQISGPGIPANTTISQFTDSQHVVMGNAATANGTNQNYTIERILSRMRTIARGDADSGTNGLIAQIQSLASTASTYSVPIAIALMHEPSVAPSKIDNCQYLDCNGSSQDFKDMYHHLFYIVHKAGSDQSGYGNHWLRVIYIEVDSAINSESDPNRPADADYDLLGPDVYNFYRFKSASTGWKYASDSGKLGTNASGNILEVAVAHNKHILLAEVGTHPGCPGGYTTSGSPTLEDAQCGSTDTSPTKNQYFQNLAQYLTLDTQADHALIQQWVEGFIYFHQHDYAAHDWQFTNRQDTTTNKESSTGCPPSWTKLCWNGDYDSTDSDAKGWGQFVTNNSTYNNNRASWFVATKGTSGSANRKPQVF
jgi:hypothetical protein